MLQFDILNTEEPEYFTVRSWNNGTTNWDLISPSGSNPSFKCQDGASYVVYESAWGIVSFYDPTSSKVQLLSATTGSIGVDSIDLTVASPHTFSFVGSISDNLGNNDTRFGWGDAAINRATGMVMYFGGAAGSGGYTYEISAASFNSGGGSFTKTATTRHPPLVGSTLVYDPNVEKIFAFGGFEGGVFSDDGSLVTKYDYSSEVFIWDSGEWLLSDADLKPSPRAFANVVYMEAEEKFLLFGGESDNGHPLNDTWEFSY